MSLTPQVYLCLLTLERPHWTDGAGVINTNHRNYDRLAAIARKPRVFKEGLSVTYRGVKRSLPQARKSLILPDYILPVLHVQVVTGTRTGVIIVQVR